MSAHRLALSIEPGEYAICRLPAESEPPAWALAAAHYSITRTRDEMSIVVDGSSVPADVVASRGWQLFRVAGPMPLDQSGILASVTSPLAAARVSVFAMATYDTDYILIPAAQHAIAVRALEAAGHSVSTKY
ncbi:MAG: ACT domain-containing protein [Casimicrobiaceae bacterium]